MTDGKIKKICSVRRPYTKADPADRFNRFVEKIENGCWEWRGSRLPSGYGRFSFDGASMGLAHRFSYSIFCGPLVDGMQIDHLCRNTGCVNPKHLEQVTPVENILRSIPFRRTYSSDACKNGHPWTERSRYLKKSGKLNCRTCRNESMILYRNRKKTA